MCKNLKVKTVTVVGANGTMGRNVSAIFASFGHAKVYMVSRDLKKSEAAKNVAYQSVRAESVKNNMFPADYSMLESCVAESDLVFESSAENWDVKSSVTRMIADAAAKHIGQCRKTIFCTGTSGLSITGLSKLYPEELRGNYIGIHMFNPPYTMTLCEMTPTEYSNRSLFEAAKEYCRTVLFRTVVEVKDSPAFLGNRIGFQFINEALQYAEKYKYKGGIDYIDAILGSFTGRNMAPLITSDFVGLDVHKAIVDNIYENSNDYARDTFILPEFSNRLVAEGKLGRKSGGGLYQRIKYESGLTRQTVYDVNTGLYRDVIPYVFPFADKMKCRIAEGDYVKAFECLVNNHSQEAEICLSFLLKYIIYSLYATEEVGYTIEAADDVMATGFNWCPPLAMYQALSTVVDVPALIKERLSEVCSKIDVDPLLADVKPSKYDYRLYFKSGR